MIQYFGQDNKKLKNDILVVIYFTIVHTFR